MSNRVNLTLDVTKTGIQNPLIKIRQGDGGFETLRTTVTSNGEPLDLQGWTITFMGTTAGNHKIVDGKVKLVEAPNGIFDYTPSKAWGMDIGEFKIAYFKFVKGDGSASSANFRVNVIEAVNLTQEEAQDYISVIDTTIAEINNHLTDSLANVKQSIAETSSTVGSLSAQVSSAANQVDSAASNATLVTSNAVDNVNSVASSAVANINSVASSAAINEAELVHKTGTETIAGDKTFTSTINGNAATATKWQTARTLALDGDVTGSAAIDGSNNVSIATTGTNLVHKTSDETIAGNKTFTNDVNIGGKLNSSNEYLEIGSRVKSADKSGVTSMWFGWKVYWTIRNGYATYQIQPTSNGTITPGSKSDEKLPAEACPLYKLFVPLRWGGQGFSINTDGAFENDTGVNIDPGASWTSAVSATLQGW